MTASNQAKTYGQTVTFAGTEFTTSGLQNGETVGSATLTSAGAVSTAHVAGSPYAITASAASGGTFTAGDYSISYAPGALTVNQAALVGDGEQPGENVWPDGDVCGHGVHDERVAER